MLTQVLTKKKTCQKLVLELTVASCLASHVGERLVQQATHHTGDHHRRSPYKLKSGPEQAQSKFSSTHWRRNQAKSRERNSNLWTPALTSRRRCLFSRRRNLFSFGWRINQARSRKRNSNLWKSGLRVSPEIFFFAGDPFFLDRDPHGREKVCSERNTWTQAWGTRRRLTWERASL